MRRRNGFNVPADIVVIVPIAYVLYTPSTEFLVSMFLVVTVNVKNTTENAKVLIYSTN